MQEKQDQKVVLVSLSIHINLEHEEHTQKNKTQINLHKQLNTTILPFNQPNNTLWPVSIKYIIYTRFSHLICGFCATYIAEGDPISKMMLMKFINQMESCTEVYWTKKRNMSQFWIHWCWWRWEKVIESNGGDILFTHPFPWVS